MAGTWLGRKTLVTSLRLALLTTSISIVSFAAPAVKTPAPAPEPALPSPQLTLKVTPGASGGPWRMQIENTGEGPIRIPADPRLLVLDLTPAAAPAETTPAAKNKKPVATTPPRCILPDDARPSTDEGRDLVIPPKRTWSTTFDPLFYCFGARERAALVAGTQVKARFGWPASLTAKKAPALTPPLAATPVGASVGKVAPAKALEADAFVLSEAVSIAGTPGKGAADDGASTTVTLSVPETMDAARGSELTTNVSLMNGSERSIALLYRSDMIQFNVTGPAGSVSCGLPKSVASPIRELFITVPVRGRADSAVLFTTTCPPGTFDEPGVYRVLPRLDTQSASGRSLGMKTWDGIALGKAPLLLRVRSPRKPTPLARPTLD